MPHRRFGGRWSLAALVGAAAVAVAVVVVAPSASADAPMLVTITLTPANPSVPVGSTVQLTATGTYSDGSTLDLTDQVVWSSAGSSVTESNAAGSQGLASAVSVGSAALSATLSGVTGSATMSVTTRVFFPGAIQHVIWIMMENHSESEIIGSTKAPYINFLAAQYGSGANVWGISHPSAPNYVGATSGIPLASLPVVDCTGCKQAGPDLFTQGETWRSYQESMTVPCKPWKTPDGLYVPRHNPALYFTDIPAATCQADDLPYTALAADLAAHTLPAFSFITPNIVNDMHTSTTGTSIQAGDIWLANNLPQLLNSPEYLDGSTVVFVMWDEGGGGGDFKGIDCTAVTSGESCHVPLLVISPYGVPGTLSANYANHYSVLRATEDLLGLPELGQAQSAPNLLADYGLTIIPPPPPPATDR